MHRLLIIILSLPHPLMPLHLVNPPFNIPHSIVLTCSRHRNIQPTNYTLLHIHPLCYCLFVTSLLALSTFTLSRLMCVCIRGWLGHSSFFQFGLASLVWLRLFPLPWFARFVMTSVVWTQQPLVVDTFIPFPLQWFCLCIIVCSHLTQMSVHESVHFNQVLG